MSQIYTHKMQFAFPPPVEKPLTVGRLVWFHTLSFHNWYIINSNITFDARAPDPFKYELWKNKEKADQRATSGKCSAGFCSALNCTSGLGLIYERFLRCRKPQLSSHTLVRWTQRMRELWRLLCFRTSWEIAELLVVSLVIYLVSPGQLHRYANCTSVFI